MAEEKKSIEISYKANINDLKKKLEQLPDITSQEAKKMVSALDRQLKQAERAAKRSAEASRKAARASSKAAKQGSKDFEKMASSASIVASSFAAMGAGVVMFSQELADLTNELTDASAKTGIAIETLAGLRLAAKGSGMEFSNLETGLIRFQGSMLDASRGSATMAESFKSLGVEVKDADGNLRDADTVFNEAIKSLGAMENQTERNATAMKLFGKEGGAGLIQSGALDNLENMTDLAREFGVAIDQDAINAMGNFQRKMAEFDTVAQGTFQRLLESVSGKNSVALGIDAASKAMVYFGSIAQDTLGFVSQSFENLFGIQQALTMALMGDWQQAKELIKSLGDETGEAAANFANMFERANTELDKFTELSKKSTENQKEQVSLAKDFAKENKKIVDLEKERQKLLKEAISLGDEEINAYAAKQQAARDLEMMTAELKAKNAEDTQAQLDLELLKMEERYRKEEENLLRIGVVSGDMEAAKEAAHLLALERENEFYETVSEHQKRIREEQLETASAVGLAVTDSLAAITGILGVIAGENEDAQEKIFKANKAIAMADITIKTAQAIAAAMLIPVPGLRGAAIATATATGAAQLATVASQQPSFHMGGVVPGEVPATLLGGEAVLDRSTVNRLGGEEGVRQLQNNGTSDQNVTVQFSYKHIGKWDSDRKKRQARRVGSRGF